MHLIYFPSLQDHDPRLFVVQCHEAAVFFIYFVQFKAVMTRSEVPKPLLCMVRTGSPNVFFIFFFFFSELRLVLRNRC